MTDLTELRNRYLTLINDILPAHIQQPIRFNHCFARVVLDYLFQGKWYDHLSARPAYKNLSATQLTQAIQRMETWLEDREVLVEDNKRSLQ